MSEETVKLDRIITGGQTIGTLSNGKKALLWGGLPDEKVKFRATKKKAKFIEGIVTEVLEENPDRIEPTEPNSYLSTSPWQIMKFEAEQHYKAALIEEAFELHDIVLPNPIEVHTDNTIYGYRNKLEFSWYGDIDAISSVETLDVAFFRRGSKGKVIVEGSALARPEINHLALAIRDLLRTKEVTARDLKTLLIRSNQQGDCVWQLYSKEKIENLITQAEADKLPALGGEIIYSNPKSPASVITEKLASYGKTSLTDTVLGVPFRYATEGFFQVNLPLYEQSLRDMQRWLSPDDRVVDLYSGVGSIGLTIGGDAVTLVEMNPSAVKEMEQNIVRLGKKAQAILAPSEKSLEYITKDHVIIVDPPRAGLHQSVVDRLIEVQPKRILYLSCNPVTQARDTALLSTKYGIKSHKGYNFFPRTPHIEHLVILDLQT